MTFRLLDVFRMARAISEKLHSAISTSILLSAVIILAKNDIEKLFDKYSVDQSTNKRFFKPNQFVPKMKYNTDGYTLEAVKIMQIAMKRALFFNSGMCDIPHLLSAIVDSHECDAYEEILKLIMRDFELEQFANDVTELCLDSLIYKVTKILDKRMTRFSPGNDPDRIKFADEAKERFKKVINDLGKSMITGNCSIDD